MNEHPIHDMMVTAMENLKDMIDVNTIIGDPIETPDRSTVILPVSKVGFGFAAGGSEFGKSSQQSDDGQGQGQVVHRIRSVEELVGVFRLIQSAFSSSSARCEDGSFGSRDSYRREIN